MEALETARSVLVPAIVLGELRAEMLDAASSSVIPGFEMSNCSPLRGDRLDGELQWRKARVSSLTGKAVRIRFGLRRASLYAFWTR